MDVLPLAGRVAFFWSKTVAHEVSQSAMGETVGEGSSLCWSHMMINEVSWPAGGTVYQGNSLYCLVQIVARFRLMQCWVMPSMDAGPGQGRPTHPHPLVQGIAPCSSI